MLAWKHGFTFSGHSMEHDLDRGDHDHGFTRLREVFVIFAMATIAANPSKSSLHDPSPRQDLKFMKISLSFDNFQQPATTQFYPFDQLAGVSAVRPNQLQPRAFPLDFMQ